MKKRLIKYEFVEMDIQTEAKKYKLTYQYSLLFGLIKFNKIEIEEVDQYSYSPKYWDTILNKPTIETMAKTLK